MGTTCGGSRCCGLCDGDAAMDATSSTDATRPNQAGWILWVGRAGTPIMCDARQQWEREVDTSYWHLDLCWYLYPVLPWCLFSPILKPKKGGWKKPRPPVPEFCAWPSYGMEKGLIRPTPRCGGLADCWWKNGRFADSKAHLFWPNGSCHFVYEMDLWKLYDSQRLVSLRNWSLYLQSPRFSSSCILLMVLNKWTTA